MKLLHSSAMALQIGAHGDNEAGSRQPDADALERWQHATCVCTLRRGVLIDRDQALCQAHPASGGLRPFGRRLADLSA